MKLHIWIGMARGLDKVDEQSDLHFFEMGMLYTEHKRFYAKDNTFSKLVHILVHTTLYRNRAISTILFSNCLQQSLRDRGPVRFTDETITR